MNVLSWSTPAPIGNTLMAQFCRCTVSRSQSNLADFFQIRYIYVGCCCGVKVSALYLQSRDRHLTVFAWEFKRMAKFLKSPVSSSTEQYEGVQPQSTRSSPMVGQSVWVLPRLSRTNMYPSKGLSGAVSGGGPSARSGLSMELQACAFTLCTPLWPIKIRTRGEGKQYSCSCSQRKPL